MWIYFSKIVGKTTECAIVLIWQDMTSKKQDQNEAKLLLRGPCTLCATRRFIGALMLLHLRTTCGPEVSFLSEQQLIYSITRNRYWFNYCKETRHVDDSNISSDSMFEMSNSCFFTHEGWSLLRNYNIAALIWALMQLQASSDRLHAVLQFRKNQSALVCNIGTSRASQSIRDSRVKWHPMNLEDTHRHSSFQMNSIHLVLFAFSV